LSSVSPEPALCQEYPLRSEAPAGLELGDSEPLGRVFLGAATTPTRSSLWSPPKGTTSLFSTPYPDFLAGSGSLARRMRI
jgi:hypothetical protein